MTTIEGPIRGRPWSAPLADLGERRYVMEEFIVAGTATSYEPVGDLSADGRWTAKPADTAPYRSRVLVVRPSDASTFNGTAFVHWLNVTAGYELGTADNPEILDGSMWIGVSAQRVGIHGRPQGAPAYSGRQLPGKPLREWNPERYGTLEHPGDRFSFDIFTQAARLARSDHAVTGGLPVRNVVALGASQSGARLTTYVNAVHPLERAFDAFVPTITSGWGTPLDDAGMIRPSPTRLRDDVDAPVLVLNSECEAAGMFRARRDDDERFRFWEVAGAPHAVAMVQRERGDGRVDNTLSYQPVMSAAIRHVRRWLDDGTPPPSQPRIEFASADPPVVARDEHGNAVGGIRLAELAAPVAEYHGRDEDAPGLVSLYGWARPFTPDELRALYDSRDAYRQAFERGVDDLAASGGLRPQDVDGQKARAAEIAAALDLPA